MTNLYKNLSGIVFGFVIASSASAEVCDNRPSKILGTTNSTVAATAATGLGTAGGAATVAGFYTLVHASSGLTMLGSTMAGTSAAGTIGIIGGTGGAIGGAAAVLLNPLVWVPALLVGVGGASFEATCAFLVDERITDYDRVTQIMREFAAEADPKYFRLLEKTVNPFIEITDEQGQKLTYRVENLYIVDGTLMHRDRLRNTKIGRVVFVPADETISQVKEAE